MLRNLTMKKTPGRIEGGFSLIELLIAMAVTLIVGASVVSLLVQGDTAFRTQPDLTERQQNVRASMDLIMRDIANAGAGLPVDAQVFSRQVAPVVDAGLVAVDGAGMLSPFGTRTDILQMVTNDSGRDPVPACQNGGVNVRLFPTSVDFSKNMAVTLIMTNGTYSVRTITDGDKEDNSHAQGCDDVGQKHPRLMFTRGQDTSDRNPGGTVCGPDRFGVGTSPMGCEVREVSFADVVRYEIVADDDGTLSLQRTSAAGKQIVARGIEDLQVTYRRAADVTNALNSAPEACSNNACPPLPLTLPDAIVPATAAALDAVTVEVQVELAARGNLVANAGARTTSMLAAGMSDPAADGSQAFRQRLFSRGTPRSALVHLAGAEATPRWQ
jgi:prepilin-type N-terminal cleavage/methylation domain-containing protein